MDLHNNLKFSEALASQTISTDTATNGNWIDLSGFEAMEFVIQSATITDGTYTPSISVANEDDQSDAAAISTDYLLGTYAGATFAASDDNTSKKIGIRQGAGVGYKYARLTLTSASTSSGGSIAAIAVQGQASTAPVA